MPIRINALASTEWRLTRTNYITKYKRDDIRLLDPKVTNLITVLALHTSFHYKNYKWFKIIYNGKTKFKIQKTLSANF